MAERKKVFIPSTILHPDGAAVFAQDPNLELVYALTPEERASMRTSPEKRRELEGRMHQVLAAALPEIHALCGLGLTGHLPITADMIGQAGRLEVIFIPAAGTDMIDVGAAAEHGVVVVNAPGANATPVAEHAIGMMLGLTRHIADADRDAHRDKRVDIMAVMRRGPLSMLTGKTLGIVGFGFVGRTIAAMCRAAFNMKVIAFDPLFDPIEASRQGIELIENLEDLLERCDFVSINAPLNQHTRGMIGAAQLKRMKKTAYLINTGRGPIVDTSALVQALRDRTIAGAGLDVTDPEPLPAGHPLFDLDNVILTPHMGGNAPETFRTSAVTTARLALDVLQGRRPMHIVNPAAWDRLQARRKSAAA